MEEFMPIEPSQAAQLNQVEVGNPMESIIPLQGPAPVENVRGKLERFCQLDPRLARPTCEETLNDGIWLTKFVVTFGNKKISAVVKEINKKRARRLAAEGLYRQVKIETDKDPLPPGMRRVKKKSRKEWNRNNKKNDKKTHLFVLPPSPDPSTDTALGEAIDFFNNVPKEKLEYMDIHSFRSKTPEEVAKDKEFNEQNLKYRKCRSALLRRPYNQTQPGEVIWHKTSSKIEDTPFLSMFLWVGKEHKFWKRKKKQVCIFDNHPQVDNLIHLLHERRVLVRKVNIMDFDAIVDEIIVLPPELEVEVPEEK